MNRSVAVLQGDKVGFSVSGSLRRIVVVVNAMEERKTLTAQATISFNQPSLLSETETNGDCPIHSESTPIVFFIE